MLTTRSEFYKQLKDAHLSIMTVRETFGEPRTLGDQLFVNSMDDALSKIKDMMNELIELEMSEAKHVTQR
jgi:hypothetical protein